MSTRTIKKYPNRRLYDTELSHYITVSDLRQLIVEGEEFIVIDVASGDNITRSVLLQIINEQESSGQPLFTAITSPVACCCRSSTSRRAPASRCSPLRFSPTSSASTAAPLRRCLPTILSVAWGCLSSSSRLIRIVWQIFWARRPWAQCPRWLVATLQCGRMCRMISCARQAW